MENTMTTETQYIKKNQQLPQDIHDIFSEIISNDVRDQLIRELRQTGWTLESISLASKLTRERVRQISNTVPEAEFNVRDVIEIPEPPIKVEKPKPVYVEPHPDTLARLLELQPYAQQVRSNGKKYREEAEEYTKLLNHAHTVEGVTLYRLAKRLGVTHGALRFRLVRYGYKQPVTATSKVYTPIVAENRLK
jgi:lambda repressor-like predicted transcriptional regulator